MEYLSHSPATLLRYVPFLVNDYPYTFLDHFAPYGPKGSREAFYLYLNSLEDFQLQNIWNALHRDWCALQERAHALPHFKRSPYSKHPTETHYIHTPFTDQTFDQRLQAFIAGDTLKTLFLMNVLLKHGIPSPGSLQSNL